MKNLFKKLIKGDKTFRVRHISEKGTIVDTILKAKNSEEAVRLANASSPSTLKFVEVMVEGK